jgi:DNA recombination protein RmuC
METAVVALATIVVLLLLLLVVFSRRPASPDKLSDSLRAELQALSLDALSSNSEQFLRLADERLKRESEAGSKDLEGKKRLIDDRLAEIKNQLDRVDSSVKGVDTGLSTKLETFGKQTLALTSTTDSLRQVLSNSRARGQWGERLAEDILRVIGLREGINYQKQVTLPGPGSRPDFVFALPGGLSLNMDVKFPFDNYKRFTEADTDADRETHQKAFFRDVRERVNEISTREYIDPEGGTVDYALMFVPNEGVYAFIHENDSNVFDYSLGLKVVCCSPNMLFAMLALVDQAAKTLGLQKASEDLLKLYGSFSSQWRKYTDSLDLLGSRLSRTQRAYDDVSGVRLRALERPLNRIEELRQQRGLPVAEGFQEHLLPEPDALAEEDDEDDSEKAGA